MKSKLDLIICPRCHRQYLPAEIYVNLLGRPERVQRDYTGKIVDYEGTTVDGVESYRCDGCDTPFIVQCKLQFSASVNEKLDSATDYSTPLELKKITLFEG